MAIKRYRTILEKSNPSVVREFQIDDSRSCQDLLKTIALIHGWETDEYIVTSAINGNFNSFSVKDTISSLAIVCAQNNSREKAAKIIFPCVKNGNSDFKFFWTFRIEEMPEEVEEEMSGQTLQVEEKIAGQDLKAEEKINGRTLQAKQKINGRNLQSEEKTEGRNLQSEEKTEGRVPKAENEVKEPLLLRSRGLNPLPGCGNIISWNQIHYDLLKYGSNTYYGMSGESSAEGQTPNPELINTKLNYRIRLGRKPVKLNKNLAQPLSSILDDRTVSDLKDIIYRLGMNISTNQKKANLIASMTKALNNPQIWNSVLDEMSPKEYLDFVEICTGKLVPKEIWISSLEKRGMIYHSKYWGDDKIPSELMDYYEYLVSQGMDDEILKYKKIDNVMEACRNLYAIFSFKQAVKVADCMYPGEFTPDDIRKKWKTAGKYALLSPEVIYCIFNMKESDARAIYKQQEFMKIPYFTPTQEELFYISEGILHFPKKGQSVIESQLKRMLENEYDSHYDPEFIASCIYSMYHLGWKRPQIEKVLQTDYFHSASRASFNRLFQITETFLDDIHRVDLRGQSFNSWENVERLRRREAAAERAKNKQAGLEDDWLENVINGQAGAAGGQQNGRNGQAGGQQNVRNGQAGAAGGQQSNNQNSQTRMAAPKIYPNSPCPCGSGKKYKFCCGRN